MGGNPGFGERGRQQLMKEDYRRKIEAIMNGDGFSGKTSLGAFLFAASMVYGAGVRLRNACYDSGLFHGKELPCRIVSIGNIVAGGTGKTPMTIAVADMLKHMGHRPVILSRGYGGHAEKTGIVVSDGYELLCGPAMAGDEPFMMASKSRGVPVLAGSDRYKSGMHAISEFDPDVILLDDGFQHRRLHRNLDLLLLDAGNMFGNGYLVPRGVLREPVTALKRSDAVIFTRCGSAPEIPDHAAMAGRLTRIAPQASEGLHEKPVFQSNHVPFLTGIREGHAPFPMGIPTTSAESDVSVLMGSNVFVFSGIARNRDFLTAVETHAGRVAGHMAFPDHHPYTDAECEEIMRRAVAAGADVLATTEKDYVRVAGKMPGDVPIAVVGVKIIFTGDDEAAFVRFIRERLARS